MRRVEVVYRPQALGDLERIYDVIEGSRGSEVVAQRFVGRIMARCRKLGDAPYGGRSRDVLKPGLRTVSFERSAVIAYVVMDAVEITNIFYGGRDYEALYRSGDVGERSATDAS